MSDAPARFDLLQLADGATQHRFTLTARDALCTPFRFLYGGSGIAASAEAAEQATGRPVQWITTQFLAPPQPGDELDIEVDVLATGRASSQTQVAVRSGGRVMLSSLCAHNVRPAGDERAFSPMPDVPTPDDCGELFEPFESTEHESFFDHIERRLASGRFGREAVGERQAGTLAIWSRLTEGEIGSAATQGFVADMGPLAACARLGLPPGGTSLDNTVRVVDAQSSEWVLLELEVDGFARSTAHTTTRVWSEDGRLLGVAQQSAIIRTSHHER